MKSLTIADIWQNKGKKIPVNKLTIFKNTIAATFRNVDSYFKEGLTFSSRGMYAPTFRYNSSGIFHTNGACIFFDSKIDLNFILSSINSTFIKYIAKNYIEHSVAFEIDKLKDIILNLGDKDLKEKLKKKTLSIIQNQKQNSKYDYITNEQIEIDKLVHQMYNLNGEDIQEVENWYFRRYPKLAKVVEEKLKEKRL